jgi:hypothetical protein
MTYPAYSLNQRTFSSWDVGMRQKKNKDDFKHYARTGLATYDSDAGEVHKCIGSEYDGEFNWFVV